MTFNPWKAGGWGFGEVLTSAQMNQGNTDFVFAVDGRNGGTYTPTAAIVVNGTGLQVGGSGLAVTGTSYLSGVINASGGFVNVFGSVLSLDASSPITSASGATFGAPVHAPKGVVAGGLVASTTYLYSSAAVDKVFANGSPGAGVVWRISDTPSTTNVIRFWNGSSSPVAIQNPAGTLILSIRSSTGSPFMVEVTCLSGVWTITELAYLP
jgi:hypothetical protein